MSTSILAGLLLLATIVPETGRFKIYQNGKKVGSEEFTISPRNGGGYLAEARTELVGESTPITSRMELDAQLNPTSYEYQRGAAAIRITIGKPVSEYVAVTDGKESEIDF